MAIPDHQNVLMSSIYKILITPNALSETSTIYDLEDNEIKGHVPIGHSPIVTGMMQKSLSGTR